MKNEQLRKHLKKTLRSRFRYWHLRSSIGKAGDNIYVDKNVEIQRYPRNVSIGSDAVLKEGARICACNETAEILIGKNTTVGFHTFIFSSEHISIGDNCLIAPFVYVVDSDHTIDVGTLINQQANSTKPIKIGNDVWLGTGCKILKGVTIGNGAVVAAGAVVTSDIGPNEIFGGIPAKKISERN
ncbi:MAG: acetyltransferase-like isoleucine patch superfamily enzyme [Cyclobacteriaceae bacterium]|jgi:acetyltransferase-like isoleucine patch superfamily enzyme